MDHKISPSLELFFIPMLIILLLIPESTIAQSHYCSNTTTFANNSQFQANLNTLLNTFLHYFSYNLTNGYYQAVSNNSNSKNEIIYGHALCNGDPSSCKDCVTSATIELPNKYCPNQKNALVWYNSCLLRYSDQSFFGDYDGRGSTIAIAYDERKVPGNASQFDEVLGNMMTNEIAVRAALGGSQKKFATEFANYTMLHTIYGLGQCTPDLSGSDCKACLENGYQQFVRNMRGGRVLQYSCDIRYELFPFFDLSTLPSPPQPSPQPPQQAPTDSTSSDGKKFSTKVVIAIVIPTVTVLVGLLVIGICFVKRKKEHKIYKAVVEIGEYSESLQYELAMLQSATNKFSDENKLGEGGFGGVYKATLPNGEKVAVKRLSKTSIQGEQQFKNEVLLVAKLQHRNLLRLLGFCLEGQEKLLAYEYLPNKSLDNFLFDCDSQVVLGWGTRYKLIRGIARGMLYLHHDSQLRIIHRDLKASNVLVDADMNPKISDFGTARIFGVDESQGNTSKVVGTYGYMSPEYAMQGQFSNKSDVYSFGVLVLEIISGKRNNTFYQSGEADDLISNAWKQWRDSMILEFVDPAIRNSVSVDEVMRCIHLGLLCVQESPDDRPTMATIMLTLDSYSVTLPVPEAPGFFIKSRMESKINKEVGSDQSSSKSQHWSVNVVSVTEPEPR